MSDRNPPFPSDEFDDLTERLAGVDGPRQMPGALRESLEALLSGADPVAALATTDTDGPRPIPPRIEDRLSAALTDHAGRRGQAARRGRIGLGTTAGASPWVLRAVAVFVAMVLVAGTVSAATELSRQRSSDEIEMVLPSPSKPPSTTEPSPTTAVPASTTTTTRPVAPPRDLVALGSCDDLLSHFRSNALALVEQDAGGAWSTGAYGSPSARTTAGAAGVDLQAGGDPVASTSASPAPQSVVADASGTNVQEPGVDEPDTVKVEPGRVFTIANDTRGPVVRALKPTGRGASLLGTFDLPPEAAGARLLLAGDRLLALATVWSAERRGPWTTVWAIDVSEPARLRLASTVAIEGTYTTARLVDGLIRVVVAGGPVGPPVVYPRDESPEAAAHAKQKNVDAVRGSTLDDWVPNYELTTFREGKATTETGRACACEDTLRPVEFSGFGSATVLTIDPKDPAPDNVASVTGAAGITYASPTDLYVASGWYHPAVPGTAASRSAPDLAPSISKPRHETKIHQFSIAEPVARYVASGAVPGSLLNQFSMSQHKDHLRVASTLSDSQRERGIDNVVSVLRRVDGELKVVGHVAGLGHPGERIEGVRMMGTTGYVVTFRQTDPLYVIDLSDPARPTVLGELEIPGVSTYLHPMGSGALIGIGAEATDEGRRTGVGMSVFDVRDLSKPKRAAHLVLGPGMSAAERNHHAFLYWARTSTVVVPYLHYGGAGESGPVSSAVVVRATPTQLAEVGRVSHAGRAADDSRSAYGGLSTIERSAVIGEELWTFSASGVLINDLASLQERAWVGYFDR